MGVLLEFDSVGEDMRKSCCSVLQLQKVSLLIKVIIPEVPEWGHIKYTLCIWVMFEHT